MNGWGPDALREGQQQQQQQPHGTLPAQARQGERASAQRCMLLVLLLLTCPLVLPPRWACLC